MTMPSKKEILFHKQNGKCHYCGVKMILHGSTAVLKRPARKKLASKDHIIPRSHGGSHNMSNLVCACAHCNAKRGNMPYHLFVWIQKNHPQWKMVVRRWHKTEPEKRTSFMLKLRQAHVYV